MIEQKTEQPVVCWRCNGTGWHTINHLPDLVLCFECRGVGRLAAAVESQQPPHEEQTRSVQRAGCIAPLKSEPSACGTTAGGGRRVLPPLWKRVWICLRHWKSWRARRKIDAAAAVLWNQGIDYDLGHELSELSDRLWREAWAAGDSASDRERKQYNAEISEERP